MCLQCQYMKQLDLARIEAMDESAEWRRRFDYGFEKASKCSSNLDLLSCRHGSLKDRQIVIYDYGIAGKDL
ncbi:hypothetical protein CASFOL_042630 [Castilleja foliolosa]|uniref:Uncharacterized protein n=1 Tax=Castilleja foliolosa TaxID=1961234 RepID=A0ABD3B8S2_9LAMI